MNALERRQRISSLKYKLSQPIWLDPEMAQRYFDELYFRIGELEAGRDDPTDEYQTIISTTGTGVGITLNKENNDSVE